MIKGSIYQEDITIINACDPNIKAPKYMKHTLSELKAEIDSNTVIEDFHTKCSIMDRLSIQTENE